MKRGSYQSQPLLIEWSPSLVRAFNPSTRHSVYGETIQACVTASDAGREIIVAVSQRSTFIRCLSVPNASRREIGRVVEIQLERLLPLSPREYIFDFRLGAEIAVVGAIKAESLQKIHSETNAAGLRIRAILPLSFGSWLASRAKGLNNCAVVGTHQGVLNVDVVQNGELCYSRSLPLPDSQSEIEDEIARTFSIAEAAHAPVLAMGSSGIPGDESDDKESIEYLADSAILDKLLFSFEPAEQGEAKSARLHRWVALRALAAATIAISLGGYSYLRSQPQPRTIPDARSRALMREAQAKQAKARTRLAKAEKANKILGVAFEPGQTATDMITVLANAASPNSWFTNLSIGRGLPITINGVAFGDAEVSKFLAEISKDPRFREMKVVSTSKASIGKKQLTHFLVSGKPVGTLAFDHPPKEAKRT